jgi:hypothetical protein
MSEKEFVEYWNNSNSILNNSIFGWLTPNGYFAKVNSSMGHYNFAKEYLENKELYSYDEKDDCLMRLGFIRISENSYKKLLDNDCLENYIHRNWRITKQQVDWLLKNNNVLLQKIKGELK